MATDRELRKSKNDELCITFVIFAIKTSFLYQITAKLQCYYCKNPVITNCYFTRDLNVKSIKILTKIYITLVWRTNLTRNVIYILYSQRKNREQIILQTNFTTHCIFEV